MCVGRSLRPQTVHAYGLASAMQTVPACAISGTSAPAQAGEVMPSDSLQQLVEGRELLIMLRPKGGCRRVARRARHTVVMLPWHSPRPRQARSACGIAS